MEWLLKIAKKKCDQVEIYSCDNASNIISFEDSKLKNITSRIQSGISLRIIKKNKLGFAFTKNLIDREEFVRNALNNLRAGVTSHFNFPYTKKVNDLHTYDPSIHEASNSVIADECTRVSTMINRRTKGQVNITAGTASNTIKLINSSGTDLSCKRSYYFLVPTLLYPNSYSAMKRIFFSSSFKITPASLIHYLTDTYNNASKQVQPKGGIIKVLFMPETIHVLLWRLQSAVNGKNVYYKESPISREIGKKLFEKKLTVFNDPLNDAIPGARSFDDEGTPCKNFPIIRNGVLDNFYYDLNYASKMRTKSTGHGFRQAHWTGDAVIYKPVPSVQHLFIKPGSMSFKKLVASIDNGVIVAGALGAHSGNIPNGDYSIGLSPGIYVHRGAIVGRVRDGMIAGNIYDTMKNIIAIEDSLHSTNWGTFPSILFDNVSVVSK